ncbi:MAG TPA: M23 family metallopeptidase [Gemmatimonadales bacterium]|nr:M23 family metallopeptidase [Gemmatimonadales bacterium]
MPWRPSHYVTASVLAVGTLAALGATGRALWRRPPVAPPILVTTAYTTFADTLGRRETLSDVLARAGVHGRNYARFLETAAHLDVRRLKPGLVFTFRRVHGDSAADRVVVRPGPAQRLHYARTDSGWTETVEAIPWTVQRVRVSGAIATSLYDALDAAVPDSILPAGERQVLAWGIADVYDWEVDFTRDIRAGDQFEVLLERLQSPDGERRFGRILAARVEVAHTPSYAFYFEPDASKGGYYDDQGRSLKRAFLRAPLQFRRISSRFGNRYHPILHMYRNHEGIDYAAAYGTPVRATADGVVTRVARDGGYGNLIELRHANGIRTRYGHLSAYASGLHVGERVTQGQTIGYVGSTGLSTGPHLHYEFLVNGRPTNPQRKDVGSGQPVPQPARAAFDALRGELQIALEPPVAPSVARVD